MIGWGDWSGIRILENSWIRKVSHVWRKRNGASRRRKDLEQFASDTREHMALIVMRKNPLRKLLEDIGKMAGGLAGRDVGYGRVQIELSTTLTVEIDEKNNWFWMPDE
jgi:hypothetical protein